MTDHVWLLRQRLQRRGADAKLREHRENFDAARVAADALLSALGRAQLFFTFGTTITFTIEARGKSHRADFGAGHRIALEKQSFEKALSNLVHDDIATSFASGTAAATQRVGVRNEGEWS